MSDLEHILEKEYAKKANEPTLITPSMLMEMVEGVMGGSLTHVTTKILQLMKDRFDTPYMEVEDVSADGRTIKILVPTTDRKAHAESIAHLLKIEYEPKEGYNIKLLSSKERIIGAGVYRGNGYLVKYLLKPLRTSMIHNKGDVAEGILGAAIACAFVSGGHQITVKKVESFLAELDNEKNKIPDSSKVAKVLVKPIKRKDSTVDTITCVIRLSKINFNDLMNEKKRDSLASILKSAVAFANSEEILEASRTVATNGEDNKVAIVSDGVSKQKSTKIDIKVFLDGEKTPLGRISLKAGATKQLGQVGGSWEGIAGLFRRMFGIEIDESNKESWNRVKDEKRTIDNVRKEVKKVYVDATKKINDMINPVGDDKKKEVDFIRTIAAGMMYQVALEEAGVLLVHLDEGEFEILDFSLLEKVLRDKEVDLTAVVREGLTNPTIDIIDRKADRKNQQLFQIRFKPEAEGKVLRHYIEKGRYMVRLLADARKEQAISRNA